MHLGALPSNQPLVRTPRSMTPSPSTDAPPADHFAAGPSWLLPEHSDRRRMVDMDRRLRPIRMAVLGVLALALVLSGAEVGYWTLLPLVLAGGLFALADRLMDRVSRPEYLVFAAWAGSQIVIAASVIYTNDVNSTAVAWLAIPVVTLSARFSLRGIVVGVVFTLLLVFAVPLAIDLQGALDRPTILIAPVALVICIAILTTPMMRSDIQHRGEAVIDPLTGMFNRKALANRTTELEQQSAITGDPVTVIAADLDCFKNVNDSLGHAGGDAVLKDVAYLLRKQLRAFDLSYRLGGEEFVVLLPGANVDQGAKISEQLRAAVEANCFQDTEVTMSFGVSASERGKPFEFDSVLAEADEALYEAKRSGRNRVCVLRPAHTDIVPVTV